MGDTYNYGGAAAFFGHMGVAIALGMASKLSYINLTQTWVPHTELPNPESVFHLWES